jgi:hypothetical protein
MKIVLILLMIGLIVGLVVPYLLRDIVSGTGIQLPQFIWSKSPPRIFPVSVAVVCRIAGMAFALLAVLRFIIVWRSVGR